MSKDYTIQRYSIKDLENISGIKAHTIRIWEQRYQVFEPQRTSTNIRYYLDKDLKKLLNIAILLNYGHKISQVALFSDEQLHEKVVQVSMEELTADNSVNQLTIAMIEFDLDQFKNVIDRSVDQIGLEKTMHEVIYPFFNKTGILWQTNSITPAQEHFASNIIKQKLFSAIDNLPDNQSKKNSFVLFLKENEQHELGLLYYYYLIKKAGFYCIYLGQNVPLTDIIKLCTSKNIDYLFTSFTSYISKEEIIEYLEAINKHLPSIKIIISGIQASKASDNLSDKTNLIPDSHQLVSFLKKI